MKTVALRRENTQTDCGKDPIKPKKHKPAHKDLEAYSCDKEADEDGFFDENPL